LFAVFQLGFLFLFLQIFEEGEIPLEQPEGVPESFEQEVEMLLDNNERFTEELAGAGVAVADRHTSVPEINFQNKNVAPHRAKKRWHSVGASEPRAQQKFPR
jgi:hypothetical protein